MERWDAYDREGNRLGVDLVRGEAIPEGMYHLICSVVVRHADGDFLLTRRALTKSVCPGVYEVGCGGCARKGEDARTCIRRELREETGLEAEELRLLDCLTDGDDRCLVYRFACATAAPKDSVRLQEGETDEYRWVSENELLAMTDRGEFIPVMEGRVRGYFEAMENR